MNDNESMKSNKLRNKPIKRLIILMSLPSIFSMLVQALYNIVDSLYIKSYSDNAYTALNLSFPLQMLLMAFPIGIGVGTNALISRKLGQRKNLDASIACNNGLFLSIIAGSVFMLLGTFLPRLFLGLYTSDKSILSFGTSYLTIILIGCLPMFIDMVLAKSLQATGNMIVPMVSQLVGAITNIILDPIFIFNFNMGIEGAAIATIIGQTLACIITLTMFFTLKHDIKLKLKHFLFRKDIISKIVIVAIPVTIMNSIFSVTSALLNSLLIKHSTHAVDVLGTYNKVQSFIFMPVFGLSQGTMPILGYNYGAKNKERFIQAFKFASCISFAIMFAGFIIFQLFNEQILSMFGNDEEYMSIGKNAFRIICWCFLPASINIIMSVTFQALGMGIMSLFQSLIRQVVVLVPSSYLFYYSFGIHKLWFSFLTAEGIGLVIFVPLIIYMINKCFKDKEALFSNEALLNE